MHVFIKNSFYHQTIHIVSPVTRNFLWGEISIFPGFNHCKQICQEIMAINFTGAVFVNLSNLFTTWPAQGGNFYFEPYCREQTKGGTLYTVRNGEGILGLVSSNTWFLRLIDIYTLSFRPRGLIIFFGTPFFPPLQVFFSLVLVLCK